MKKLTYAIIFMLALPLFSQTSFHDFSAKNIHGDSISMSIFKGKKLLVVNTASLCGYTYQYGELQDLYDQYSSMGFEIVGFPANDFGQQEPGTDSTISEFCQENYGVTFTMMSKIRVTGTTAHPIYQWLTQKSKNGVKSSTVNWNFQKYLIDENGKLVDVVLTQVSPLASVITNWITTTSVEDNPNFSANIQVSPNPNSGLLQIDFLQNVANVSNLGIYSLAGNLLIDLTGELSGQNSLSTDISSLANGTYFIIGMIDGKNSIQKIVKN